MPTILKTKNSVTTTVVPTTLQQGELAVNITDKKMWVGNAATTPVQLFGAGADGSFVNLAYTGTLTGGTGVVNLGSGQFYKDASGNIGLGRTNPSWKIDMLVSSGANALNITDATASDFQVIAGVSSGVVRVGPSAGAMAFYSNNTERVRITDAGNVGIGTSSPAVKLEISGNGELLRFDGSAGQNRSMYFRNVSTSNTAKIFTDGIMTIGSNAVAPLTFITQDSERARVESNGNFMVSTTDNNPGYFNTGTGTRIGGGVIVTSSAGGSIFANPTSGGGVLMSFGTQNNWNTGTISTNNSNTSYNTSSDYRLKENISPMVGALAIVSALKPCTYTWKADGSNGEGFIAHELQEVCPLAVTGKKDAVNEDGTIKAQGIDTSFLVATLTAAIQEQQALIENLTTRLNALEGK
jgi:hypothetical protein